MKKRSKILLFLCGLLLAFSPIYSQVTIGANKAPEKFSVLELVSNDKGLRLPQIETNAQRDAIFTNAEGFATNQLVLGLQIFNMQTNCVEYWNGTQWISLCLGTANIKLIGDICEYDEHALIPADGNEPHCTYTPVDDPPCVLPGGHAYTVIATGTAYATLIVDEITSAFSLIFKENFSHSERSVIVRVINNCSGEFKEFIFTQAGAECPSNAVAFTLDKNTAEICGNSGAAIVYVTNPQDGIDYVWEHGGVIVNRGNYMEITSPGEYTVYAGLIGCPAPTPQHIYITQNTNTTSLSVPVIHASNGGILCGSGSVTLTATNVTESVVWFHNGNLYNGPQTNPLTVSGAAMAGEWFAVQQTNGNPPCGSRISNKITLIDQTNNTSSLAAPNVYINGTAMSGVTTACKSGSLELKVSNTTYPVGTIYEWFDNGVCIKTTTDSIFYYTVPANKESMVLSVMVKDNSGGCPKTAISNPITVSFTAPVPTTINNAASTAAICGSNPAILHAMNNTGTSYQWFKDGVLIPLENTDTYSTMQTGVYTVRYSDGNCWSMISLPITVFQSAPVSVHWHVEPDASPIVNTQESCTAVTSPAPDRYIWSSSNTAVATVTPIGDGSTASINYIAIGTAIITVTAENACGAVSLQKTVDVTTGCMPITSVSITPAGVITRALDENGQPKDNSESTTLFASSATNGSPATSYEWYVDGIPQPGENSATFTFFTPTPNAGSYVIYAAALNGCTYSNEAKSPTVTVNVTKDNAVDLSGNYRLSGKNCFDVKRSNDGVGDCAPLNSRTDDFATTKTFDYTFATTSSYTNLTFEVIDNNNLIVNKSTAGNIYTITFRNDINTVAIGRDKTSALKLTIVAKFNDNTGAPKQIMFDVAVQDCTCGCTVKKAGGGYITFMCYNLGAADVVKTMRPMEQAFTSSPTGTNVTNSTVYGDLYQWGRRADGHEKRTSPVYNSASSGFSTAWDANGQVPSGNTMYGKFIIVSTGGIGDWHGNSNTYKNDNLWNFSIYPANNPCPAGWRVPTQEEWSSIMQGGTPGTTGSVANNIPTAGQTLNSGNFWKWNPASNGTAGWLVSPDGGVNYTLFLPANGNRDLYNGAFNNAGAIGTYWASLTGTVAQMTPTGLTPATSGALRANGFAVRCVQE